MADTLSHIDESGSARMVDVSDKPGTLRRAVATTTVRLSPRTFELLSRNALPKGDVLTTARLAGIQAAKRTAELIPLCHPLFLSFVEVRPTPDAARASVVIEAEARTTGPTGVEMEALVAAQVAALTIYDMCKAVQKDIVIDDCRLVHKSGGRSGTYEAAELEAESSKLKAQS
ncbi:MAG: cyclic pyranopterin monophosphate synthase MoaC [Desulfovibrionales bacterium]